MFMATAFDLGDEEGGIHPRDKQVRVIWLLCCFPSMDGWINKWLGWDQTWVGVKRPVLGKGLVVFVDGRVAVWGQKRTPRPSSSPSPCLYTHTSFLALSPFHAHSYTQSTNQDTYRLMTIQ